MEESGMKIVKADPDGTFTFSAIDADCEFIIDGDRAIVFDAGPVLDEELVTKDELDVYFQKFGCPCYTDDIEVIFDPHCPHHPGRVTEYMGFCGFDDMLRSIAYFEHAGWLSAQQCLALRANVNRVKKRGLKEPIETWRPVGWQPHRSQPHLNMRTS
jgi:hypothetical protein